MAVVIAAPIHFPAAETRRVAVAGNGTPKLTKGLVRWSEAIRRKATATLKMP
jgi:hypothetical protein